jgi:hypothetical protein
MLTQVDIDFALEIGCACKGALYGYKKDTNWYSLYIRYMLWIAQNNCIGYVSHLNCQK